MKKSSHLSKSKQYHCLFHQNNFAIKINTMDNILKSKIQYKGPKTENLIEFIRDGLKRNSQCNIIIDSASGRSWTGQDMENTILHIAKFLIDECNLQKGDVCTLFGEPNDYFTILILALISAGATVNYITHVYRGREVLETSKALKVKYLISTHDLLEKVKSDLAEIETNLHVISCDQVCDGFSHGCKTIGQLLSKFPSPPENTSFDDLIQKLDINHEKDFAVIQFSSGTTGKPKPIPRTHKNLCHLVASVDHEELMNLRPGEVIAGSLSITHRPGLWALLACVNGGSTFVLWDNLSDVEDALRVIEKYKVTVFSSSLPFLSMLGNIGVKIKDKFNLSSLKHLITSGAKIVHADLPETIMKEFHLETLRQCFGMTEAGWVFIIENSLARDNYLSVGHPVPGMEVIVIDPETGKSLGPNERGELGLKSAQIFPGYLTDASGVFNRSDFTSDGWFRSGDQVYYTETGLVYIEGRYKELMIFRNNGRCFPSEIENLISDHPAIEGVCAVKVGKGEMGFDYDIVRAYVTLKQGFSLTEKELIDFIDERSCEIVLEGGVKFLDKFPRLTNGKVDKQSLKTMK